MVPSRWRGQPVLCNTCTREEARTRRRLDGWARSGACSIWGSRRVYCTGVDLARASCMREDSKMSGGWLLADYRAHPDGGLDGGEGITLPMSRRTVSVLSHLARSRGAAAMLPC
jgi:hypothetical protein